MKKRLFSSIDSWNKETTRSYQLAMSVGVVFHNLEERRSVTDLLVEADELMYKQKKEKKQQLGLILPRATLETPPEKKSPRSSVDSIQK